MLVCDVLQEPQLVAVTDRRGQGERGLAVHADVDPKAPVVAPDARAKLAPAQT